MSEGAQYSLRIDRIGCPYQFGGKALDTTTTAPSLSASLQPSAADESYLLRLTARKEGRLVGNLQTHGINGGLGWDYRFRVR